MNIKQLILRQTKNLNVRELFPEKAKPIYLSWNT